VTFAVVTRRSSPSLFSASTESPPTTSCDAQVDPGGGQAGRSNAGDRRVCAGRGADHRENGLDYQAASGDARRQQRDLVGGSGSRGHRMPPRRGCWCTQCSGSGRVQRRTLNTMAAGLRFAGDGGEHR
jgi:hypothetical protein